MNGETQICDTASLHLGCVEKRMDGKTGTSCLQLLHRGRALATRLERKV